MVSNHNMRNGPNFTRLGDRRARLKGPLGGRVITELPCSCSCADGTSTFPEFRNVEMRIWLPVRLGYFGSGIPSWRQIFLARRSATSVWRGTVVTRRGSARLHTCCVFLLTRQVHTRIALSGGSIPSASPRPRAARSPPCSSGVWIDRTVLESCKPRQLGFLAPVLKSPLGEDARYIVRPRDPPLAVFNKACLNFHAFLSS